VYRRISAALAEQGHATGSGKPHAASAIQKMLRRYADPPWHFRNWSAKGTGRNAISHYDCLDFAALPVAEAAADDCALFLWAIDPLLPRAIELIKAWGFDYKTVAFYWVKLNSAAKHDADFFTGLGYWTRANPEQCLLATGGKPMRHGKDVRRLVVEKRREHSRKPDCVRERIERLVAGPYLELFSRETKQGWECWGNQVTLFDKAPFQHGVSPLGLSMHPLALLAPNLPGRLLRLRRCLRPLVTRHGRMLSIAHPPTHPPSPSCGQSRCRHVRRLRQPLSRVGERYSRRCSACDVRPAGQHHPCTRIANF
jgi:N6-adenosine-specific RNA methylase IME4